MARLLPELAARALRELVEKVTPMNPRETIRPHERIKDPADFRRAFDRKRSVSDGRLIIYGVENGRSYARLGISVSRKKVRKAVQRNRLKRLIREAFRKRKAELPTGLDLVVVPREPSLTFEDAARSLATLGRDLARKLGVAAPLAPTSPFIPAPPPPGWPADR